MEACGSKFLTAKDINLLELTEAAKRFVGRAWSGSHLSRKPEETGSGKGQEIGRLSGQIHSQGHISEMVCFDIRHSLCSTTSATTGPWTPYFSPSSEF